ATQLPVCLVAWLVMPLKRLVDPEFKTGACGEDIIEKSDLVGVSQILQFRLADFGGVTQETSVEKIRGERRPCGIAPQAEHGRHYGRQHVVIEDVSVAHDLEVIDVPLGWHGKSSIACGGYNRGTPAATLRSHPRAACQRICGPRPLWRTTERDLPQPGLLPRGLWERRPPANGCHAPGLDLGFAPHASSAVGLLHPSQWVPAAADATPRRNPRVCERGRPWPGRDIGRVKDRRTQSRPSPVSSRGTLAASIYRGAPPKRDTRWRRWPRNSHPKPSLPDKGSHSNALPSRRNWEPRAGLRHSAPGCGKARRGSRSSDCGPCDEALL